MAKRIAVMAVLTLAACGAQQTETTAPETTTTEVNQLGPAIHIERDPTEHLDEALTRATSTTTTTRASRSRPPTTRPQRPAMVGGRVYGVRVVSSTAYCLTSRTADGGRGYVGSVAMNGVPFGSRWLVRSGPMAGQVLEVNDRIGHSSEFDVWMPSCDAAITYGRRQIEVERVG